MFDIRRRLRVGIHHYLIGGRGTPIREGAISPLFIMDNRRGGFILFVIFGHGDPLHAHYGRGHT
jgi:hypothetical protein